MPRHFPNVGVVEGQLPEDVVANLWTVINEARDEPEDMKPELAGNISSSIRLDGSSPLLEEFRSVFTDSLFLLIILERFKMDAFISSIDALDWVTLAAWSSEVSFSLANCLDDITILLLQWLKFSCNDLS